MSRLPTVGGDRDTWGQVLNDYLDVAHNTDGTQKTDPAWFVVTAYGAEGDGHTDDTAAIQAAIDAAAAVRGGIVYVPGGSHDYMISAPLLLPEGVRLKGAGPTASSIDALDSFTGTAMVKNKITDGTQETSWIEDIQLRGRGVAPACVIFDNLFITSGLKRVVTTASAGTGITITSSSGSAGPVYLRDIWSFNHAHDCVAVTGAIRQIWMDNITAEKMGNGYAGVRLATTGGSGAGHRIHGLHLENYEAGVTAIGLVIDNCRAVDVAGVYAAGYGTAAFSDIVQITNGATAVEIRMVVAGTGVTTNIINDTVNSAVVSASSSPMAAYVTQASQGPGAAGADTDTLPTPAGQNLLGWSFDPAAAEKDALQLNNGVFYLARVPVPATVIITNVIAYNSTAGSGLVASQNFAGLLKSDGTLIGSSANQATAWQSAGLQTMALADGPYTVVGGPDVFVWVVFVANNSAGANPKWAASTAEVTGQGLVNAGLDTSHSRAGTYGTAQTVLASITPASMSPLSSLIWVGLS